MRRASDGQEITEGATLMLCWQQLEAAKPACPDEEQKIDRPRCTNRVMWMGFYEDHAYDEREFCVALTRTE